MRYRRARSAAEKRHRQLVGLNLGLILLPVVILLAVVLDKAGVSDTAGV